jgi:hypothetical protein
MGKISKDYNYQEKLLKFIKIKEALNVVLGRSDTTYSSCNYLIRNLTGQKFYSKLPLKSEVNISS